MSIINDALKKVQNNITDKNPASAKQPKRASAPPQPTTAPSPAAPTAQPQSIIKDRPLSESKPAANPTPASRTSSFRSPSPMYVVMSLCLLAIAFLWTKWTPMEETRATARKTKAKTPDIKVQGIMTMENRKVVLIDQEIYQIGDSVKGMTLMEISIDEVKLMKDGEIITVEVKP